MVFSPLAHVSPAHGAIRATQARKATHEPLFRNPLGFWCNSPASSDRPKHLLRSSVEGVPRRQFLGRLLGASAATLALGPLGSRASAPQVGAQSVRDYGAVGDGTALDTQAIQAAINACAGVGGGTVFFPTGKYLTGSLFLKSHVTLHLDAGATILGSLKLDDYPVKIPALRSYTDNYTERALIYAEDLENIAIEGRGVIDGRGAAFKGPYTVRPYLMRIVGCRGVSVCQITIKDSPMWVQHYLACDDVLIDGITVRSQVNLNNDGIDIDGCHNVRISNCDIRSGDDALVLKSTLDRLCQNVVITNCPLSSGSNAFKLGTESSGGFLDIVLSNCVFYDTRLSGIALETVDGGALERVSISNVTMRNVRNAIFIRLGNRARPFRKGLATPGVGRLRQVRISNVQAVGADAIGCSITGLPDHPVEDIALDNISIRSTGGGKADDTARQILEQEANYPEYAMFGPLPAYGFFCRHARGLRFSRMQLEVAATDGRPSLVCRDVSGLDVFDWRPAVPADASPITLLGDTQEVLIHGCQSPEKTRTYLRVEGNRSARIRLLGNDLGDTAKVIALGAEVPARAVEASHTPLVSPTNP
jgi:polygalacturonase